ncbi:PAS domain-containing protein [Ensifer canadensis]
MPTLLPLAIVRSWLELLVYANSRRAQVYLNSLEDDSIGCRDKQIFMIFGKKLVAANAGDVKSPIDCDAGIDDAPRGHCLQPCSPKQGGSMVEVGERTFVVDLPDADTTDSGIFTWDIAQDLVYGDAALAELFGLVAEETNCGLPLKLYLDRVHPEDRPRLAKKITETIVGGRAQQSAYRVKTHGGRYVSVIAFGRCFRDRKGSPVLYSGIVVLESATSTNDNRKH